MMSSSLHPPELIARYEKIYFSTKDRLITFVKRNIRDQQAMEDIVQDCYIQVWKKMETLKDDDKIMPFLQLIVKNLIIDHLRKKSRASVRTKVFYDQMELTQRGPDEQFYFKEIMQEYRKTIDAMPPRRRMIYRMVREQGFSHQEIAKRLNISVNTIERQINEAMKVLRAKFKTDKLTCIAIALVLQEWMRMG